jgi:hypothetical protein
VEKMAKSEGEKDFDKLMKKRAVTIKRTKNMGSHINKLNKCRQ